jgi:hypothetical protein
LVKVDSESDAYSHKKGPGCAGTRQRYTI